MDFDRHNARIMLHYCILPNAPNFSSLPSTFNLPGQLLTVPETLVKDVEEALRAMHCIACSLYPRGCFLTGGDLQQLQEEEYVHGRGGGSHPALVAPLPWGPYAVLDRSLEDGGRTEVVSVDRLYQGSSSSLRVTIRPPLGGSPLEERIYTKQQRRNPPT
jgi:hypothetical protein